MELEQLQALTGSFEELKKAIEAEKPPNDNEDLIKQYDIAEHAVMDKTKRPDKIKDDGGVVEVTRIAVPLQKLIVSRAAAFLCGNPVELQYTAEEGSVEANLAQMLQKVWDDNKLDYEAKKLAKHMMSECRCAELWYVEPAVDGLYWAGTPFEGSSFRLRMKVLAPSLGDTLIPTYNAAGDMVAFSRAYQLTQNGKKVECFDVYTELQTLKGIKGEGGWTATPELNIVGKIPVIYYSQDKPEWADVQSIADRLEKLLSNHGESNNYFAFPKLAVYGEILGALNRDDYGGVLQFENGAKADVLAPPQASESLKLEYQNLRSLLFDMTDTPDISLEQMKGLGTYSGIALKMLFLGAHLKAADKEENFGKSIQRRINYLIAALKKINVKHEKAVLTVKPRFEYFLPKNDAEKVQLISEAYTSKIISQKTAVSHNPLVSDAVQEMEELDKEANSAGGLDSAFAA